MGLKDLFNKNKDEEVNVYVIDKATFKLFIIEQIEKAQVLKYSIVESITLFLDGNKKTIFFSYNIEDGSIKVEYDGLEFQNLDGFFEQVIDPIKNEHFKIELDWNDEDMLINYKRAHPELKPDDY